MSATGGLLGKLFEESLVSGRIVLSRYRMRKSVHAADTICSTRLHQVDTPFEFLYNSASQPFDKVVLLAVYHAGGLHETKSLIGISLTGHQF